MSWAAVLFDLDGTLADTTELILRCYRHTMEIHLGQAPPDELWMAGMGTPLREQLKDFARDAEEAARMAETYSSYQRTIHDDMVRAFPGAVEVVLALKATGAAVGVVTSRRTPMAERTLARAGPGRGDGRPSGSRRRGEGEAGPGACAHGARSEPEGFQRIAEIETEATGRM